MTNLNLFAIRTMVARATSNARLQCKPMSLYDAQGKAFPELAAY